MTFPRLRAWGACICLLCVPGFAGIVGTRLSITPLAKRTEIYRGVFYELSQAIEGRVHLIEVNLGAPGVDFYLTPLDPDARANGHQYRLDYVRNVARAEGLAVAVNATMFSSDSYMLPMVGDFATSIDTIIADYEISHLQLRDFLLWCDSTLTPYVETDRPAPPRALEQAKWAIGTQNLVSRSKKFRPGDGPRDKRCALGIDPTRKRLFICVMEQASRKETTEYLLAAGAEHVMMLDGGDSTSLYLGGRANGVPHGLRVGGQRPVATVLGIKADPILPPL